ncbi:response regulator transcription factor [Streptococcus mutans]|uniref:response regulator transcription factor n=1 Tax=Streptococcus mutans TaxID=1309 RepID=UPI0002B5BBFD|nr:response regulator transcription factor [Streptococcus mutans]EMB59451.1 Two-component system response regulator [Streptococcus mutans 1SM1]EMB64383.1 Two-component system response regulator [Streptococcus mutans 4SM1]EMB71533.1 Two-component system response regulator [Streptococcus mutans 15VF2]EMC49798.1 Two-component system response regulator [Streptococcus mutans SA38]MCB4995437.1 response regulator transcription factor [Streptococcus mutans]
MSEKEMSIKLAVIDDHKLVLQGLCKQLEEVDDIEILGSFTEVNALLLFLKQNEVDILISDLILKDTHGFDLVAKIGEEINPELKIILISGFYEELVHQQAIDMGVYAFLRKESSVKELIDCIHEVKRGNQIIPNSIIKEKTTTFLTPTEKEVLKLVAEEYTNEEIAKLLSMSHRTVASHVTAICQKLNVKGRVGAAREAIKMNLN